MNGAKQAGGRGEGSVEPGESRERIAGFEAALRAYLQNQLDFPALRQELEDALYADLSCAPLTLELIEDLYQQGTLPPRPYTALKDDVEKTVAEEAGNTEILSHHTSGDPFEAHAPESTIQRPQPDGGADRTLPIQPAAPAGDAPAAPHAAGTDRTLPIRRVPAPKPAGAAKRGSPGAATVKRAPAPAQAAAAPFEAGHVLRNRFVLQSRIGAGGMGIVYRALDRRKQEAHDGNPYVALKILRHEFRQRPDSLSSLQQEALKAQRLSHPNIVNVFDFDRDGDAVFMTMELLEGETLARLMNRLHPRRLPREQAMAIIAGMARGLAYAHDQNIVHYDFKPGNVVLTHDGRIKILDFGIARAAPGDTLYTFDSGGQLNAMTPAYASCEMLQEGEPDPRDDIYGLACVSYELLAGRHPFNRQSAVRARQQKMKPARIKGLKRAQWKALERGLRFHRSERTPSAGQFLLDIQDGSTAKPEAEVAYTGLVKRPPPLPHKRKGIGLLVLAVIVAVGAYFGEAFVQWYTTDRDTPPGELAGPPAGTGVSPEPADTGESAEPELETIAPVPDPTIVTTDERTPEPDETVAPPAGDEPAPAAETAGEPAPAEGDPTPAPADSDVADAQPPAAAELPAEPAAELPAETGTPVEESAQVAAAEPAPAVPSGPGRIAFIRRGYSINESGSVLVIEVMREGGATGEVAVAFATDDGSARADRDYGRFDLSVLTFEEGQTLRELYVPIVSDALAEDDETFYVTLMNPSGGAELGDDMTATVTIVDDDF